MCVFVLYILCVLAQYTHIFIYSIYLLAYKFLVENVCTAESNAAKYEYEHAKDRRVHHHFQMNGTGNVLVHIVRHKHDITNIERSERRGGEALYTHSLTGYQYHHTKLMVFNNSK